MSNHKTSASFIIIEYKTTNAERLVKVGPVVVEIFSEISQFLPSFLPSCCKNSLPPFLNSKVTKPIFTTFPYDVEAFMPRIMHAFTNDIAFCFGTSEQRVKAVHFNVCKINAISQKLCQFLPHDAMLSAAYAIVVCLCVCLSVCLCVCRTPVLYQNG